MIEGGRVRVYFGVLRISGDGELMVRCQWDL